VLSDHQSLSNVRLLKVKSETLTLTKIILSIILKIIIGLYFLISFIAHYVVPFSSCARLASNKIFLERVESFRE